MGVEEELQKEISEVWPFLRESNGTLNSHLLPDFQVMRGGVEFEAPLELGLQLNFFLKLANRILLRVDQFRAVEFPKLFHRCMQIEWSSLLSPGTKVAFEVSAEKSKLGQEKKIAQVLKEVFEKRKFQVSTESKQDQKVDVQKVFVRFSSDVCTLSLDTSGVLLHKRGVGDLKGQAPLRETWAQYCLRQMIQGRPFASLREIVLLDPMAGSGTFLIEARQLLSPVTTRGFSFQKWSLCPLFLKSAQFLSQKRPQVFSKYIAIDADIKMSSIITENWLKLAEVDELHVITADSNQLRKEIPKDSWLICNPPYGDRLDIEGGATHQDLLNSWAKSLSPQKMALLVPVAIASRLKAPHGYIRASKIEFSNGGLPVSFLVWEIG